MRGPPARVATRSSTAFRAHGAEEVVLYLHRQGSRKVAGRHRRVGYTAEVRDEQGRRKLRLARLTSGARRERRM